MFHSSSPSSSSSSSPSSSSTLSNRPYRYHRVVGHDAPGSIQTFQVGQTTDSITNIHLNNDNDDGDDDDDDKNANIFKTMIAYGERSIMNINNTNLILMFKYVKSIRFILFVLLVILFVIQFKSGPFMSPTTANNNYYYYNSNNQSSLPSSSTLLAKILGHSPSATIQIDNNQTNVDNVTILSLKQISPASSPSSSSNVLAAVHSSLSSIALSTNDHQSVPTTMFNDKSQNVSSSRTSANNRTLPNCPLIPPKLVGRLKVLTKPPNEMEELEKMLPNVEIGGRYRPKNCQSRDRVAIIVPYRDRQYHLKTFLMNIHPMLMRQNIDYGIYIVEQYGNGLFNRAKLMNVGFLESSKQYPYDCFIFHDVDLIPEDDRNLYTCPQFPRHMSVAIDKFRYRLPYVDIFGGVSALTREQFVKVNGFSNEFWGWGGEDDDMSNRIHHYGYNITRYPVDIARYKMLKHEKTTPNADRFKKLYNGWRRFKTDGINNIKYKVIDLVFKKLYTWISVDLYAPDKTKKKSLFPG